MILASPVPGGTLQDSIRRPSARPRGITLVEVVVVLAIVFLGIMLAVFALPRRRETARLAGCRRNLMQIGIALELYDATEGVLPTVPELASDPPATGGPLRSMLQSLALPDLSELTEASRRPAPRTGLLAVEHLIPGFLCPSDRTEMDLARFPAPVSYRATTGDQAAGKNGGFAPGRPLRLRDIESGDGRTFTAAFSERLIGGEPGSPASYLLVPGPISERGCGLNIPMNWRNDAGRSWAEASWRSSLYTHALTPGARPSCIARDNQTAFMGASSGHSGGVNVLIFDGSVRTFTPSVDTTIWKSLATTESR